MNAAQLADRLDVIAKDIARANINGFGNQVAQVADELRALGGGTNPALLELLAADREYDSALQRMPTKYLGRGYANGLDRIERAKERRRCALAKIASSPAATVEW